MRELVEDQHYRLVAQTQNAVRAFENTYGTSTRMPRELRPSLQAGDPWLRHTVRRYESPGQEGATPQLAPAPTRNAVRTGDGTVYLVYTDSSFRLRQSRLTGTYERRAIGLSGRQRVLGRKRLRVLIVAEQRRQHHI